MVALTQTFPRVKSCGSSHAGNGWDQNRSASGLAASLDQNFLHHIRRNLTVGGAMANGEG